jgi:hypothetical protein
LHPGKEIDDVNARWKDMETADANRKAFLLEELRRVQLAESKAERFNAKANAHEVGRLAETGIGSSRLGKESRSS